MIVFRTDANETIGMGHYMRCFAIAHELVKRGQEVLFLIAPDADAMAVQEQGFPLWQLRQQGRELGWDAAEAAGWLSAQPVDVLFIDTYRINQPSMKTLAEVVPDSWYMDDLCAFDYPVSNIVNYNLDAAVEMYQSLLSHPSKLCIGASYYPVRQEILDARVRSLRPVVQRVLIATGATDPFHMAQALLEELAPRFADVTFAVQLGKYYDDAYLAKLQTLAETHTNICLLDWTKRMGERYAACDVCITPGSSMMSESMTVGVPCISFAFADNHLGQCIFMDRADMASYAGDVRTGAIAVCKNVSAALASLLPLDERNFQRVRFAQLFDGKGAARVAEALTKTYVRTRGGDTRLCDLVRVMGSRASAILYNFVRSNALTGTALMPANICECVPATYRKAGMDIAFCDITFGTWEPDEQQITEILASRPKIRVLHYNRTYGDTSDRTSFFRALRERFPRLVIIDDACLSIPPTEPQETLADLVLYSTGRAKPVSLGFGAFADLRKGWAYKLYSLDGSDVAEKDAAFDQSIKCCHAKHLPAEWDVLLDDWMDPSGVPPTDYLEQVKQEHKHILHHQAVIQDIYAKLPNALPASMQGWRYNILVRNLQACLDALFAAGLFASHHYMSLGNGYFDDTKTPNSDWLEQHVINLFEGNEYTPEMAEQTVQVLQDIGRF